MNIESIKQMFASYGFNGCPLSHTEIKQCFDAEIPPDDIYNIGCDCNAGHDFNECLNDMVSHQPEIYKTCNQPI